MPAFIGLPGAREKTEIGRGLFERSEFRSPRRRAKREAGIPDNQRATFLGYFFAVGKKLRNAVILRGETPQNLHQVRILLPLLWVRRRRFLVGLPASLGMTKGCRPWKRMSFWRLQGRRIPCQVMQPSRYSVILKGFALKNLPPSERYCMRSSATFEMTLLSFWTERSEVKNLKQ